MIWKVLSNVFGWRRLRAFDPDDRQEFARQISAAVVVALRQRNHRITAGVLHGWRVTAQTLDDPVRRAILYGPVKPEDFVEVTRPGPVRP